MLRSVNTHDGGGRNVDNLMKIKNNSKLYFKVVYIFNQCNSLALKKMNFTL